MARYSGICWYLANSAAQSAADSGGTMPMTGFHSVIDRPERVSRVMPPTTTIRKINPQQRNSQAATGRRPKSAAALGATREFAVVTTEIGKIRSSYSDIGQGECAPARGQGDAIAHILLLFSSRGAPSPRLAPSPAPCMDGRGGLVGEGSGGFLLGRAAAVREALLLAGDELEQGGAAVFGLAAGAQDRVADLRRVFDPLAPPAEIAGDVGVIAAEVARPVPLVRQRHRMGLDRHRRIVQYDRQDRDAAPRRRLEIEAGHAERRIAHEVDAELIGCGDLGADREAEAGAELV